MVEKTAQEIGTHITVALPYEQAIEKTTEALKREGFGVLTRIDVKETLKQKIGADFTPYVILGACNPPLAHRALQADLDVGLLLPCNVVVYETGPNESTVGIVNPMTMLGVLPKAELEAVAQDAQARLDRVIKSLQE